MSDEPAALIVETSGSVTPAVAPFSEVAAGTVLTLADHAKVLFDDYYTCSEVTVRGGSVEFGAKGYKTSAGARASAARVPCKQEIVLKQSAEASTGVMRGAESQSVRMGTRPSFVLVGAHNRSFAAARFSLHGTEVRAVTLSGPRLKWPLLAAPLTAGENYEMALVPNSSGEPVKKIKFEAIAEPRAVKNHLLILIRVD